MSEESKDKALEKKPGKPPESTPDKIPEKTVAQGNTSTQNKASAQNKTSAKTQERKKKIEKPAKGPWLLSSIRLLFSFLLLAGLGFLGYMLTEQDKAIDVLFSQQNQYAEQEQQNVSEIDSLQNNLQNLSQQLNQANALVAEQNLEMERLERELISNRLRINDSGGASSRVWTLTEAESLLRLAQQRLIISHDVRAALALFVASDDILKQINDPAIFSIRNILASDMAALRAVTEIDVAGIYLQLGALAQSLDSMQVLSGVDKQLDTSTGSILENETEEENSGFFASMGNSFKQYIVVRRRDEPIQPLLSPEQEFYLKQNIKLQLEQARLSLLQEREDIFQSSIQQALTNIERYLESDDGQKQSVIQALNGLLEAPIVVQVPVVSNSLTAMQQMLPLMESEASNND